MAGEGGNVKNFMLFFVVAVLTAATASFGQLPTVPPHRQLRPIQPPSPSAAPSVAPATGPSPVFAAMNRIDAKAGRALAKAEQALRRAGRRPLAPAPSPITAAMSTAALDYVDTWQWDQALLRNNGDEAAARIDPGWTTYQRTRTDSAHVGAAAQSYAGLIGYDHARLTKMLADGDDAAVAITQIRQRLEAVEAGLAETKDKVSNVARTAAQAIRGDKEALGRLSTF